MGRCHHIFQREQGVVWIGGFASSDVQAGTSQMSVLQCSIQGRLIYQRTASSVDQNCPLPHQGDSALADHTDLGTRCMQGDNIAVSQQLVHIGGQTAIQIHGLKTFLRHIGVITNNGTEAAGNDFHHTATDIAQAENTNRLAFQFAVHDTQTALIIFFDHQLTTEDAVLLHHVQHQADSLLGNGICVGTRRKGYRDTSLAGGVHINSLQAHAMTADDLAVDCLFNNRCSQLYHAADDDSIIIGRYGSQALLRGIRGNIHLQTSVSQDLHAGVVHFLQQQYFHSATPFTSLRGQLQHRR